MRAEIAQWTDRANDTFRWMVLATLILGFWTLHRDNVQTSREVESLNSAISEFHYQVHDDLETTNGKLDEILSVANELVK